MTTPDRDMQYDRFYTHVVYFEKYLAHMDIWVPDHLHVLKQDVARTVENFRTHKRFKYRGIRVEEISR
jgi:hypothetical protein